MADASNIYGNLGSMPDFLPLIMQLAQKHQAAKVFGWGTQGVGGTFQLVSNHVLYQRHVTTAATGPSGIFSFPFDTALIWSKDLKRTCYFEDVLKYFGTDIAYPAWFFDWCKLLLARLRAYQPAFDAAPEAKLIWTTLVSWTVNAALGSTNIHGTILPSALYEHLTGDSFENWAGDGSYMFTAQHGAVLAPYWQDQWNEAAKRCIAKNPGNVLLDSGFKVFDRKFKVKWESAWHGSVWPVPMETARFRYDPPLFQGNDCPVSGNCKMKIGGLAGATYAGGIPNDPYVTRKSNGYYETDAVGEAVNRHARWSRFMPWVGWEPSGTIDFARIAAADPNGNALLSAAVNFSTLFGSTDTVFWQKLAEWKTPAHATPELIKTDRRVDFTWQGSSKVTGAETPLFSPNHELSFRYYYPAMIDMVLQCDYHGLVAIGANTWWKYIVGSGMSGVGTVKPYEDTEGYDPKTGAVLRNAEGIPLVQPLAPPGSPQEAYTVYREAKERDGQLKFIVNWVGTLIAIIQAVYGQYGGLVKQGRAWYQAYNEKFPKPEDTWRGVVPPTPMVMRQLFAFGMLPLNIPGSDQREYTVPSVGGATSTSPGNTGLYGGQSVMLMMQAVRGWGWLANRLGLPFNLTRDDRIDLEGLRTPVVSLQKTARSSLRVPSYPTPGTFRPGEEGVPPLPGTEPKRMPAGVKVLFFGLAAAVGAVLVSERDTVKTKVSRGVSRLKKVARRG